MVVVVVVVVVVVAAAAVLCSLCGNVEGHGRRRGRLVEHGRLWL